jgi:hypothetical protein
MIPWRRRILSVPRLAMKTVQVVKRKWDGTVSAVTNGFPLAGPRHSVAWLVRAGSRKERPRTGSVELVAWDELWVAVPGEWWVLCGQLDAARSVTGYKVHAAAAFEAPAADTEIVWVDLDLDFEVSADEAAIHDEAQFHQHAGAMGYPEHVVRGAWSGISTIAARYTNGDWPFDGSMQQWMESA